MFFVLSLVSIFFFTLQNCLIVKYTRDLDPFVVSMLRGVSLIITMLPLWLWFDPSWWHEVNLHTAGLLLIAAILGVIATLFSSFTNRYIAFVLKIIFITITMTLTTMLWSIVAQDFTMPWGGWFSAAGLMSLAFFILWHSDAYEHLDLRHQAKGIIFSILAGLFLAASLIFVAMILQFGVEPMLVAYFWESLIGLMLFMLWVIRCLGGNNKLSLPAPRVIGQIALVSSPTLIGTGCVMMAFALGPAGLVQIIQSSGIAMAAVLGGLMYREHLSSWQWLAIFGVIFFLITLRLANPDL